MTQRSTLVRTGRSSCSGDGTERLLRSRELGFRRSIDSRKRVRRRSPQAPLSVRAGRRRGVSVERSVRIDGGLKAEEVEIDLQGTSKIPTIEAEEIRVKATGAFSASAGRLTADRIEAKRSSSRQPRRRSSRAMRSASGHCVSTSSRRGSSCASSSEVRERRTSRDFSTLSDRDYRPQP